MCCTDFQCLPFYNIVLYIYIIYILYRLLYSDKMLMVSHPLQVKQEAHVADNGLFEDLDDDFYQVRIPYYLRN